MIKIISQDKENKKVAFLTDMNISLANAIRRSVLEIPVLAIREVEFFKNDSALYDEVLALRMGLVPLITEKNFSEIEKCSCKGKGCMKCSVDLKINAKGPCTVYSEGLTGKAKPAYDKLPLVILNKDQELEAVARAALGKGIEHTKFSPGLIYYRHLAKIEVDKDCDNCKKCVDACPLKILKIENEKLKIEDIYKCDLCEMCVEACKKQGKESLKISKSEELVFFIESWGQIKAEEIFIQSIKQLKENLNELKKKIK